MHLRRIESDVHRRRLGLAPLAPVAGGEGVPCERHERLRRKATAPKVVAVAQAHHPGALARRRRPLEKLTRVHQLLVWGGLAG